MAYNQTQQSGPQRVNDTVVQAAARGKFLDFRNNLVLATPEDYAMLHGAGGSKHAMKSTIKLLITDYSAGKDGSITVHTNVAPELIPYLLEVCRKNVTVASETAKAAQPLSACALKVSKLLKADALPPNNGVVYIPCPVLGLQELPSLDGYNQQAAEQYAKLQATALALAPSQDGSQWVGIPKTDLAALLEALNPPAEGPATPNGGVNFSYRQERVNVYKQENGLVPVSVLAISREGTRKSGEVSRLPWTVKITQFKARPSQQKNGTTAYNSSSKQDVTEAFIALSDFDMYRCLHRTQRFIEVWESTYGPGLIVEGLRRKEEQRTAQQGTGSMDYGVPPEDYPPQY